jgi:hypothetical protein
VARGACAGETRASAQAPAGGALRPGGASLKVIYGGKTKVYINCQVVAEYDWDRAHHYGDINISDRLDALRIGENVLAVETQRTHKREKRVDIGLYVLLNDAGRDSGTERFLCVFAPSW